METRIIHELINQRVILQYLSMLIIPTYNAITLLIVFYASLSISSNTAPIWLITTIISISIYYMWSLPLRVWVLQVWFPHTTKKDIITLHRVLAVKTKSILRRFHGLLFAGMTIFVVQNTCMICINCYDIIVTFTLLYHHHYHRSHHQSSSSMIIIIIIIIIIITIIIIIIIIYLSTSSTTTEAT